MRIPRCLALLIVICFSMFVHAQNITDPPQQSSTRTNNVVDWFYVPVFAWNKVGEVTTPVPNTKATCNGSFKACLPNHGVQVPSYELYKKELGELKENIEKTKKLLSEQKESLLKAYTDLPKRPDFREVIIRQLRDDVEFKKEVKALLKELEGE